MNTGDGQEQGYFDGDGQFSREWAEDEWQSMETDEIASAISRAYSNGFAAGYDTAIDALGNSRKMDKIRLMMRLRIHKLRYRFDVKYRALIDDIPF